MMFDSKEYMIATYGEDQVNYWLENVELDELWHCFGAVSNESLGMGHKERHLNALEYILQEQTHHLYRSVTYGVYPNMLCTEQIGYLTGRKYGNFSIAMFLIREKISDLKVFILETHPFTEREIRLLHYDVKGEL